MEEASMGVLRSSLGSLDSTGEDSKQRQPEHEVEPNMAANGKAEIRLGTIKQDPYRRARWLAAQLVPLFPY
jgi:hypothetical protein